MKKTIIIILAAVAAMSCSKFLAEHPSTSLTEEEVYSSEQALEKNVNGIVLAFQGDMMFQGNMLEALQAASALVHWGTTSFLNDERWACVLRTLTFSSSTTYNINMYGSMYNAVNRCNKLIDALPDSPVDEAYKREIEGEAKFYRGVLYFTLVRLYGDVPLVLKHASDASAISAPRTNYNEVYVQIVKDFKDAFAMMRTPERVKAVTGDQGHPNKWAAQSFLAAVYLQMASILTVPEDENFYDASKPGRKPDFSACGIGSAEQAWTLAFNTAKDVIDNGPYKLAWDYRDLYKWTRGYTDHYGRNCWNLDERIFVLQSTGSNNSDYTAVRTLPKYPEGLNITSPASTSGRIRPTRFLFQKWCEVTCGSLGDEGTDAADIYVSTEDPRLDASFIHTKFKRSDTGGTQYVYPWYVSLFTDSQSSVMPYYKKYLSPTFIGKPDLADYYFMRFAELYYIAAEAAARLGQKETALQYVDIVLKRARLSNDERTELGSPKITAEQSASTESLVNAIIWNKIFEFCGEGHEFFEVRRLGARWLNDEIVVPINEFLQDPRQDKALRRGNYYGAGFQYPAGVQKLRASLLCEFPSVEIAMNPALTLDDHNDFTWE